MISEISACHKLGLLSIKFKHQVFQYLLDAQQQTSGVTSTKQHMILTSLVRVCGMVEVGENCLYLTAMIEITKEDREGLNEVRNKSWIKKKKLKQEFKRLKGKG